MKGKLFGLRLQGCVFQGKSGWLEVTITHGHNDDNNNNDVDIVEDDDASAAADDDDITNIITVPTHSAPCFTLNPCCCFQVVDAQCDDKSLTDIEVLQQAQNQIFIFLCF